MLDNVTLSLGTIIVISKVALIAGSSQQGNALLASAACKVEILICCWMPNNSSQLTSFPTSNCVTAQYLSSPSGVVYLLR